ncbi:MAG: hypothetical protein M3619_00570 [Myxococcota bacterium]|nr:hypothetical protein [Myxococcota bacterium]
MSQVRTLVALRDAALVETTVSADRPSLPVDGVDVTNWRTNNAFSSPYVAMFLDGTVAASVNSPTGGVDGVELWGYRLSQWWRIGVINKGAPIVLAGNLQGYATKINVVGIFERLALAGTSSAGVVAVKFAPIDEWTS